MKYRLLLLLLLVGSTTLVARTSFFKFNNTWKIGLGVNEFNSVSGTVLNTEYTRLISNLIFASVRFSYANASQAGNNAYYASQKLVTAGVALKINPLVIDRHIVSLRIGLNQNFYSCSGSYGQTQSNAATVYTPYSKKINGEGYSFGANYDYLISRKYFISVGVTEIRYEQPLRYASLSIGTLF